MDGDGKKGARGRGRGRGRGGRGRARGRGRGKAPSTRGRSKKMIIESDDEEQIETSEIVDNQVDISDEGEDQNDDDDMVIDELVKPKDKPEQKFEKVEFNIDDDISQLVPPTFSTVSKGPPQPMLELSWDHKYTSVGEKIPSPNVHMCIGCKKPIRIYGRLISCKHVFCHSCALEQGDYCSCCSERVHRVEKVNLGTVYMCLHGGKPYTFDGCRRTYLSLRDLQAHVNHRHKPRNSGGSDHALSSLNSPGGCSSTGSQSHSSSSYDHGGSSSSSHYGRQNIPVHYSSSSRSNLISVPVHQAQSNSSARPPNQEQQPSTQGSRYERKPPFSRNTSWGSYNNRPF